jgi:hypothetical protein
MSNPQVPMADPNAPAIQLDPQNSAIQTEQPQVGDQVDNSAKGPEAAIPPVQQDVTVDGGSGQNQPIQTEQSDTSKIGLNPNDPKNKVQPTPQYQIPPTDPGVVQAARMNKIATMLTGGPHFTTTVDPVSGKVTRTQNQVSTKSLLLAVAMEALGGAAAGLQAKGPGNEGKAFGMGFQSGAQNSQAAQAGQQQQDQQASQDLARQAAVTATNFQTHMNAMKAGNLDYEQHKAWVADSAPVVENLRSTGGVLASGVNESDLLNKYHVTRDMAIPDGVVPRVGADGKQATNPDGSLAWDNTYTVVDPTKKISLPPDTAQMLVDMRVPGSFKTDENGKVVSALDDINASTPIKAGIVVDMMQKAAGIKLTQGQFDSQFKTLNDPSDAQKFQVNLKDALADGTLTTKGIQTISRYAGLPLNQVVATMQKDKVPADVIGQFLNLVPQGAIEKAKINQTNQEADAKAAETRKNLVITPNNADAVIADKDGKYSAEQHAEAVSVQKQSVSTAANKAGAEATARTQAEINTKVKNGISIAGQNKQQNADFGNPALNEAAKQPASPDGVNHAFLDELAKTDPRAATVKAVGEGRNTLSAYALAKQYGGDFANLVNAAYPAWDQGKTEQYHTALKQFAPGGSLGKNVSAISTALAHMQNALDAVGWSSTVPGVRNVARGMGIQSAADYNAHMLNVATEVATAYKGGIPSEPEIQDRLKALTGNPNSVKDTLRSWAIDLEGKQEANYHQFDESVPSSFVAPVQFADPQAVQSYKRLTGKDINPDLVGRSAYHQNQNPNPNNGGPNTGPNGRVQPVPQGATGKAPGSDGKMYYHDAQGKPLGIAPQ